MERRIFNKGDFVKNISYYDNDELRFGIFEGIDLEPRYQYSKSYSLVAFYDSHRYCNDAEKGWTFKKVLDVAKKDTQCKKTIDTLQENDLWKVCTIEEKENAMEILRSNGYYWDEELMALIDIETKEIVHKIILPKIEYNGETIKPICDSYKAKIKRAIIEENKITNTYYPYSGEYYQY